MDTIRAALHITAVRISLPLAALGLMLVACGSPAPRPGGSPRPAQLTALGTAALAIDQRAPRTVYRPPAPPATAPSAVAVPTAPEAPCVPSAPTSTPAAAAPSPAYIAGEATTSGTTRLELLTTSGRVVASTPINPALSWMVASGGGRAFWAEGDTVHELDAGGSVRSVGTIPSDADSLLAAPDGSAFAYAASTPHPGGTLENTITVEIVDGASRTIADRLSDPNQPRCDAPAGWTYYLISWTAPGIAFARVPTGGCGCGAFDMQMQSANTALIDPLTLRVSTLASTASCPLSALDGTGDVACFESGTGGARSLDVLRGPATVHSFTLSGLNVAGNALFSADGASLAYMTLPASADVCGGNPAYTLHVLDLGAGRVQARQLDLTLVAWPAGGPIYASEGSSIVAVDPTTLAVTTIATGSMIGLA